MATTKWTIDPTHSELLFKVKHLMISTVTGQFTKFDSTVEMDGNDITTAKIRFTADVNSVSTNNEQRDAHLKASDFFEAETYPELRFEGDKLERLDDENYKLHGVLTMRGVSKRVALNVIFGGIAGDPWGFTRAGFEVSGKINRKDFGMTFGSVTETGGVLLGYDVTIHAQTEFVKQVEEAVDAVAA